MGYGPIKPFAGTMSSGADSCTVALPGQGYGHYAVQVSTMSTAAAIAVHGSWDGTTYYPCFQRVVTSATVAVQPVTIASGVGSGGGIVDVPIHTPYVRFVASAVVSGGVQFKVFAYD